MTSGEYLAQALRAEITALENVLTHLEAEQRALRGADAQQIESAARAKDAAVRALSSLQQQRPTVAAESAEGASPNHADGALSRQIAGLDNSAENRGLQARLIALGEQCSELNAANGLLIDRLAEHTRSALRVLRQQDGDPRLYSGTGGADSTRDSQSLGKA
ncbi:MAG: flagellar protein FlgN [Halieaceae bacterium]|uniref:flagellar protein FlgN n=1 Tax=Haliea alexandrii TaxID=2448162 RepID=UPI001304C7BE|nr:flagellar protein FlgN [Haliea alexandrii]MCR9184103.1 flagellar protein FlgN [Halieaceae bacterium]